MPPLPVALRRFKQLAQRQHDEWEGGLVKMPMWIESDDATTHRPWRPIGAVWVSVRTGLLHVALPEEGCEATADLALQAFLEFGLRWGKQLTSRPSQIRVRDRALAEALAPTMAELDTTIEVVADTPHVRTALIALEEGSNETERVPGLLEIPGVRLEHVRAFASAAARFYSARPWRHLANDDLLTVDYKGAPKKMRHFCVLGRGGQEFGVSFYNSRRDFDRMLAAADAPGYLAPRLLGVTFGPTDLLPFADADLWEEHHLALASPEAHPLLGEFFMDGRHRRPEVDELVHAEAVLLALAETTEDELDAGTWQRVVETSVGPRTLSFTLPYLLEAEAAEAAASAAPQSAEGADDASPLPFDDELDEPLTPLEQAQDLAYDAMDAAGRLQLKLARRALALSEDCADAWLILGDNASTLEETLERYTNAMDAGRRVLGEARFESPSEGFWSDVDTRPYMRAVAALAATYWDAERRAEAIERWRHLLILNPNDNQGARHVIVPALLEEGLDEEAGHWLAVYPDDVNPMWPYARALWRFRTEGDAAGAVESLRKAMAEAPLVAEYLLQPQDTPDFDPDFLERGSKEEAAAASESLREAFTGTEGAMELLARTWVGEVFRASERRRATRGAGSRTKRTRGTPRRVH